MYTAVNYWDSELCPLSGNLKTEKHKEEGRLMGCDAVWLLLRTHVSEERIAFIIRVKRISELGITLAVTSN
jgi:hypothetical protein